MNKIDLIRMVAAELEVSNTDADKAINAVFNSLGSALKNKETYTHKGFGTFKVAFKDAHDAKNPKTGETIHVEGKYVPKFSFSGSFKNEVRDANK